MKSILLVVLFGLLSGCATGKYAMIAPESRGYEAVVDLEGMSKGEVFDKAYAWFDVSFMDYKDVARSANKKAGRIMAKAIVTVDIDAGLTDVPQSYHYRAVVDVKDGRARIKLGDYVETVYGHEPTYALNIDPLNRNMKQLAESFTVYMKSDSEAIANDW